ncbi:MAG: MATE family efflux transporter, partial [Oscillospiraceae bacterium]|nr:MATE family efflux transporter [Oscillospiraceae bacterium]
MEQKANTFLETTPIGTLMGKYAVPCVISLLVAALYNIVDEIFIANATYLGSYGNAANTVVFPLTIVALAIAVMIGDGCCAFVSICLGSGRHADAHRSTGSAVLLCILSSLVLSALYLGFMDPIFIYLLHMGMKGAVALVIVEVFPKGLIGIFGAANESVYYTEFAVKSFRIYLCMMILAT